MLLYRLFIAILGAVLGAGIAFFLGLTVGGGIRLVPISAFILPLFLGAAVGFIVGFSCYKLTGKVLQFLSDFI